MGHSRATIEAIARALVPGVAMTAREIQHKLAIDYHRGTVRAALALLIAEGRALAEGDILQRRYRPVEAAEALP